ncbi:MAG: dicarboxylate/amino acid:cation symporter, partial [Gammaproteobacteria bacterium]
MATATEVIKPENKRKKMSMSTLVLLSFAAGILIGLFFGEKVGWMAVIGD